MRTSQASDEGENMNAKMVEVFTSFDDTDARNAEADLKKAGIYYKAERFEQQGRKMKFKMVTFSVKPKDREAAHRIIDMAVNGDPRSEADDLGWSEEEKIL